MKKMKKFFAMFLTLAMVLGMSVTVFAEEPTPAKPVDTDKEFVTIENVEAGSTYKAYQIIDAKYNSNGFIGYVWAPGMTNEGEAVGDADAEVTSAMITDLAKNPDGLTNQKVSFDPTTDKLEVGTWMILVTPPSGDATKVYNPMIVSVYYSTDLTGDLNYPVAGSVNANQAWSLNSTTAYMKSSTVTIDKEVDTTSQGQGEVGDTVTFTLTGVIPSYSAQYTTATYKLTDTIVNGLKYTGTATVKVGDNENPTLASNTYSTAVANEATSFEISFDSAYILSLANASEADRTVVITYTAEITDAALTQVGENEVSLEYTNRPGETTEAEPDTVYTYTFSIDGVVEKVDGENAALEGAEFTLYRVNTNGVLSDPVGDPVESTADGNIKFTGLDGKDTYYLQETKAPDGYSLNDTIYEIKFTEFTPDGNGGATYKVTVNGKESGVVNYGSPAESIADQIVNVTISSLPSTGGIGTTVFTIGGCAIMIIAAGLYFSLRRKTAK